MYHEELIGPHVAHHCHGSHATIESSINPSATHSEPTLDLEALATAKRKVRRGAVLYHVGAKLEAVYIVRYGWFKTVVSLESGAEQIAEFHIRGALLGLDSIGTGVHQSSAVALEDSEVLVVPYRRIVEHSSRQVELIGHLARMLSQDIMRAQRLTLMIGQMSADERVMQFLMQISASLAAQGFSATSFMLRMTRREIGNHLGLNIETVSRVFSRLQHEGLLSVERGKQVTLHMSRWPSDDDGPAELTRAVKPSAYDPACFAPA